jgi:hypothetical protein
MAQKTHALNKIYCIVTTVPIMLKIVCAWSPEDSLSLSVAAQTFNSIQPGGKVNILGGQSIRHSKQKSVYVHVSYSEWFPR